QLLNLRADTSQKTCRGFARAMTRLGGKNSPEIVVQISGPFERVFFALTVVVFAQRDPDLRERFDFSPHAISRTRAGNLFQKLVDIFQLAQRRPTAITAAPVRARLQPDREGLSKVFSRVGLRIPGIEIQHVTAAVGL